MTDNYQCFETIFLKYVIIQNVFTLKDTRRKFWSYLRNVFINDIAAYNTEVIFM